MSKALVYVEFEKLGFAGHHTFTLNSYATCVNNELDDITPILICHKCGNNIKNSFSGYHQILDVLPIPVNPNSTVIDLINLIESMEKVVADLAERFDQLIIYTHMPSPYSLLSVLATAFKVVDPKITFLTRLCMTDQEWEWYQLPLSWLVSAADTMPNCKFTTESVNLSDYYACHTEKSLKLQFNPLPIRSRLLSKSIKKFASNYSNPFVLSFLGEAREEKGYHHLNQFIDVWSEYCPYPYTFIIHSFANVNNRTSIINNAKQAVSKISQQNNHIKYFDCPIPGHIYDSHLMRSDLIVLPYDIGKYRVRGSGVSYEAYWNFCCQAVTRGSDMEATFKGVGNLIDFQPGHLNDQDVRKMISIILKNREACNEKTTDNLHESSFSSILHSFYEETNNDSAPETDCVFNSLYSLLESKRGCGVLELVYDLRNI